MCDPADVGLTRLVGVKRPTDQAIGAAWRALLEDASLAPAVLAAVERSGALLGPLAPEPRVLVQDLMSALGRWRHHPARPVLTQLWCAPGRLALWAGGALLAFRDDDALEAVAARLDEAVSGELVRALHAVFMLDPLRAYDRLAPRFGAPSPRAGVVLDAALHALMMDISYDGKQHWGKTRGWLRADARWLDLCEAWRKLPPPDVTKLWGKREAQRIVEAAAWLRKEAETAAPVGSPTRTM